MPSIVILALVVSVLALFLAALCRTPGVTLVDVLDALGRLLPVLLSAPHGPQRDAGESPSSL